MQIIHIWGEPPEVASAKDMIQKLIVKCNSFSLSQKKKTEWARINAYSANKEMGVDLKERCENMLLDLRKEPESASAFPEQVSTLQFITFILPQF
jgi:peptide methionine sulfoxide reductase MsrB